MEISNRIADRWNAIARMLAFVAAIGLSIGLHPAHADASSGLSGHSHFSASCLAAELGKATPGNGGAAAAHADCTQLFHPSLRPPLEWTSVFTCIAVPTPPVALVRQFISAFDPPPPRLFS